MLVIKRDKTRQEFNFEKIRVAVSKAFDQCGVSVPEDLWQDLKDCFLVSVPSYMSEIDIEEIQNTVEEYISRYSWPVAKAYTIYRYEHAIRREKPLLDQVSRLFDHSDEYLMKENANKKAELTNVQQSYLGEILGAFYVRTKVFSKDVLDADDEGAIHIHDKGSCAEEGITNCSLLDLEGPLYEGTVLNEVGIDPQKKFVTACTVATQIIQGVAGLQYGGITITATHLIKALKMSLEKIKNRAEKYVMPEKKDAYIDEIYHEVLSDGIQTFMYQVNSMYTTQGQTPFLSVCLYINEAKTEEDKKFLADIIEEILKQRIKGFKDRHGNWVAPAFPKLIYMLTDNNIEKDSPYYYLTELAGKCNGSRMVPDYVSEKVMKQIHNGHCYPSMGCRSFLSEWTSKSNPEAITDKNKFYGRLNCGVVSLNLPYIAAKAKNSVILKMDETISSPSYLLRLKEEFFKTLDTYSNLAHKAHQTRLNRIKNCSVDCAPLLWRDGVFARVKDPNAKIGDIIKDEYASISLGYAGLYEMVNILGYEKHWDGAGKLLADEVMTKLNDYCATWTLEDGVRYGVYGTPMETGTLKFAKAVKRIYPEYDRLYVTNSYHIPVFEQIDPFEKLQLEGKFQPLSKNGCISYIECSDLTRNAEAIYQVQRCIYDNCMYAELNIKSCKCYTCGSEEPQQIDDNLVWYCPVCQERNPNKLRHLYRICGYASTNDSNDGRTSDVKDRFIHMDNHEV